MKRKLALALVAAMAITTFVGCSKPAEEAAGKFTDGTYEGVGKGFAGDIKVGVKVENGKITTIDILEIQDTPGLGDEGAKEVAKKIIEAQSTEVDVHSGATMSSNGTIEAVEVALGLKEAQVEEEEKKEEEVAEETEEVEETEEEVVEEEKAEEKKEEDKKEEPKKEEPKKEEPKKEEPKKEEPKKEEPKPAADGYKDGTYTGTAKGFGGDLEIEVTIKDGKIASVKATKSGETPGIGDKGIEEVAKKIIEKQSASVDAHSGATMSSNATMEAVKSALSKAK